MRSTAGQARTWTFRSVRAGSPSRRRPSSSRFRCPTSISTPSPPTTSCARAACRSASAITRAGCVPDRPSHAGRSLFGRSVLEDPRLSAVWRLSDLSTEVLYTLGVSAGGQRREIVHHDLLRHRVNYGAAQLPAIARVAAITGRAVIAQDGERVELAQPADYRVGEAILEDAVAETEQRIDRAHDLEGTIEAIDVAVEVGDDTELQQRPLVRLACRIDCSPAAAGAQNISSRGCRQPNGMCLLDRSSSAPGWATMARQVRMETG